MLLRSTQNAPKFDGKTPALLPCFLEDVDILGTAAGITDLEKIHAAIRYADLEEAEGWELLDHAGSVCSNRTVRRFGSCMTFSPSTLSPFRILRSLPS